jgi:carboxyl-terminal processing protease
MNSLIARGLVAVCFGAALGFTASLAPAVLADRQPEVEPLPWEDARLFAEVMERVKRDYVDLVDDQILIEAAIRGMIAGLDPHSAFLDPSEFRDVRVSTSGRYTGIGVEVTAEGNSIVVIAPIDGSPAARAGIVPGDIIISVDGMPVSGADLEDTVMRMRGVVGTRVVLGVLRADEQEPLVFDLERSQVAMQSVRAQFLPDGEAYVRISHFTDTTGDDLQGALRDLERRAGRPLAGLVMDLRNNPGGVLDAAVAVADVFLDEGLIVSADGRMPDARFRMEATPGDQLRGAPLSVLVNAGSASASEIVAGAFKDHGRATIIGKPTYGKGSVQTIMPLSEGRAIKLTTSRYFTPSGVSIHARGVTPDLVVEAGPDDEDMQLASAVAALHGRRTALRPDAPRAGPRVQ